jgi:Mn-dependent DtxR family transcriptional regulator
MKLYFHARIAHIMASGCLWWFGREGFEKIIPDQFRCNLNILGTPKMEPCQTRNGKLRHDNSPRQLEHGVSGQLPEGHLCAGGTRRGARDQHALAERLGVTPASITNMLQNWRLSSPASWNTNDTGVFVCQPPAERRALEIVRHHRLLETFLYEVLDYPSRRSTAKRSAWNISSRSDLKSALRPKLGTQNSIRTGIAFPRWMGKCQCRFPSL